MIKKIFPLCMIIFSANVFAQNVGIGIVTPNTSAMLDITSFDKGLLIPRMTTSRRFSIPVNATTDGLLVYDSTLKSFFYHNTTGWIEISTGGAATNYWTSASNNISNNNSGNVGIGISGAGISEKFQVDASMKLGNVFWSNASNDRLIKFGDGNFVTIGETGQDDRMTLTGRNFIFTPSSTYPGFIGINTTTPSAPLSFGNIIGEKINLWNTDATHNYGIGVQAGLLQIHSNDATADIAFGSGISSAGAAFTETMRIKGNGNVGIGNNNPQSALSFANVVGEKINLFNTDATHNYGIGIQGGLLQLHSNDINSDIAFGYGSSGTFTELARISNTVGIQTSGPNAGFWFTDRTLNTYSGWNWYATAGKANLYLYGLGDVLTADQSGNIGIGTSTPGAKLDIAGNIKIADGNQLAGRVLTTDNSGLATWADLPSTNSAFRARTGGTFPINGAGVSNNIFFSNEEYDQSNSLSGSSFTIPVTGIYHFDASVRWTLTAVGAAYPIGCFIASDLSLSQQQINNQVVQAGFAGQFTTSLSIDNYFLAGDVVHLAAFQSSGTTQTIGANTYFNGHRVN